jgi:hypothetical protein
MDLKVRYEIEFPINSSPQLLYQYINTIWIVRWFADNVILVVNFYVYMEWFWGKARLASKKSGEKVKFKWVDAENKDTEYFFWTTYFSWWVD